MLAAQWTLSKGKPAYGATITVPKGNVDATVTVTDGAGNTASATVHVG